MEGAKMLRNDVISWDTASRQGSRQFNADAVAASMDGDSVVFALADGIGDSMWAGEAARVASDVAARTPTAAGPVEAVLAAQRALDALNTGADTLLVVAMPTEDGYDIAWVGDVRAYVWDGVELTQVTSDQTMAEYFRLHDSVPTPRMEHVVTNSLRATSEERIGRTTVTGVQSLLLSSDGVHKVVATEVIQGVLAEQGTTALSRVSTLVDTAMLLGGTDNATAVLVTTVSTIPAP
nr:Serine/threonine protein phosphatase [Kibdelosporangium sp. MJ126-NF4]